MKKDTELFPFVCVRRDAVLMIELRMRRPAAEDGGSHMCVRPVQEFHKFFPVVHIFESAVFKIGAGNNESVESALFHLCDGAVESVEVVLF